MKFLFLFFIFIFSVQAQASIYCGTSSHTEIDACTVEDKFPSLFVSIYPSHSVTTELSYIEPNPCDENTVDDEATLEIETCPPWDQQTGRYFYYEQEFDDDGTPELSLYERLEMLNKPALSVFDTALAEWKISAKADYDFVQSFEMDRFRRRMVKCNYSESNSLKFKLSLIKNKDLVKRDCLLSHTAALDAEDVQLTAKKKRHDDINFGVSLIEDVLLLIPNDMDPVNKLTLLDYIAKIERLLRLGDIDGSKALTEATPVTAIFSAQLQGYLILRMTDYLGE